MFFELPKLYPITDCRLSGLSHAEQVARLCEGGARVVQLREKHLSPREFFREDDVPPEAARALLGDGAIIGFSTHGPEQAAAAARLPVDYVAIGPIFATSSKENPDPSVGLEGVARAREAVGRLPLVAIGGITLENAPSVTGAGADAVAVIGALIVADPAEITRRTRDFLARLRAGA
jgi:thiamine-phosphate pyrophosphorylase